MGWLLVGLIVLVLLVLLRASSAPPFLTVISINAITSKVSVIILLIAFVREEYGFIDIAFVFMSCAFVSGLWILKALTPGDWQLRLPGVKVLKEMRKERWQMVKLLANLCFLGSFSPLGWEPWVCFGFPIYTRLHAVGMGDTLGVGLLGLGLMLLSPNWLLRLKLGAILLLFWLINPTMSHLVAKAGLIHGVKPATDTRV